MSMGRRNDIFRCPIHILQDKIHLYSYIQTRQTSKFCLIPISPSNGYILVPIPVVTFLLFQY